jgi:M6 family metalloprotease-like protein
MGTLDVLRHIGYGTLSYGQDFLNPRANNSQTPVVTPVLLVMLDYRDQKFTAAHTPQFFRDFYFDPTSERNLPDYFKENSQGKFSLKLAGVVGPYTRRDDPSTSLADESLIDCYPGYRDTNGREVCPSSTRSDESDNTESIALAAAAGFPFQDYDVNADGKISRDELMIVRVAAARPGDGFGGAVRWNSVACANAGPGLCVDSALVVLGEDTNFMTGAHEISHLIGAIDVYGPWSSQYITNNLDYSLMGATVDTQVNSNFSTHLDPWHKMRWGWVTPKVHDLTVPMCVDLAPAAASLESALAVGSSPDPIVVYDHTLGLQQYYMMEYRSGLPVEDSWTGHYDTDIPENGLAIYYLAQDEFHVPVLRHSYIDRGEFSSSARALRSLPVARDDELWDVNRDGIFDVILQGANHLIDTQVRSTDQVHDEVALLMVSPVRAQSSSTDVNAYKIGRFGRAGVWSFRQGDFRLEYPGGIQANFLTRVARPEGAYPSLLSVALSDRAGHFPSEEELSRSEAGEPSSFRGTAACFRRASGQSRTLQLSSELPAQMALEETETTVPVLQERMQQQRSKPPSCQIQVPFGGRFQKPEGME